MNFIKRFKGILIVIGIAIIILVISFYLPEEINESVPKIADTPNSVETVESATEKPKETIKPIKKETRETLSPIPTSEVVPKPKETAQPVKKETGETLPPIPTAEVVPKPRETAKPVPTPETSLETKEPQETLVEKNTISCTLTVRCDTILNNIEKLLPEKLQLVPENGIILPVIELEFSEGDTVFDVLEKELKKRKIHFEFTKASMYDSAYIEGIGNLYEFDCGNLSGWLYRVNGQVPSVGCSQYQLKNGDKIELLYTCNMGRDL